ncbi:hypothetical protein [Tropicimonas sp. IMCC34043]|uniref:hypothetical protein n=1 Tax=Tropicimonas sp. IMCC34043 TaxID=2248760 RepID=UPI0013003E71|nr:hypothetical protein [Tropicimonas sp. IMCC34043]
MRAGDIISELVNTYPPSENYAQLGNHLVERLRNRLPEYVRYLLDSNRIEFGVVSAPEPRIYVEDCEDRTWAIVLHEDLPALLYRITRSALSTFGFRLGEEVSESGVDEEELVQILANIIWWYRETGLVFGPQYTIGPQQIQIANAICVEAETFLLAHEIAHIILYPARGEVLPEELIDRMILGLLTLGPEGVDDWDEELLADAYAVELVMGLAVNQVEDVGAVNQLRYAGVEWMLIVTKALEALGFPVSTSHPSASERLQSVRSHLKGFVEDVEIFEAIRLFPTRFEGILDRTVSVLLGETAAARSYEVKAQSLLDQMQRSLEMSARSTPPNYMQFYDSINTVLGEGYHHLLIPKLQEFIDDLRPPDPEYCMHLEFRESIGHDLSDDEKNCAEAFRQFKLIIGYFVRQNNPMGAYMRSYIEISGQHRN